jgi:thiol-disulfide isomerase/thioredoxin
MRLSFFFMALLCTTGCKTSQPDDNSSPTPPSLNAGAWTMIMDLDGTPLVQHLTLTDDLQVVFHNAEERIESESVVTNDTIYIEMPVYHTHFIGRIQNNNTISGKWYNPGKSSSYSIDFVMTKDTEINRTDWATARSQRFAVRFSPDTEDEYPAVGIIHQAGNKLKGTFLTETGDYRFLEGSLNIDHATLQCFDGSHAFHFDMTMTADSLTMGTFKSGTHWTEPFKASRNDSYTLTNPDSLTFQISEGPFTFSTMGIDGDIRTFSTPDYIGKVTIIQIIGTWCPNCLDETRYYNELAESINDERLQIIPVAFEASTDFNTNISRLKTYQQELNLQFTPYLGGRATKQAANDVFPMLNHIMSFPTSIFIDQTGKVQRIHTGFYGPGAGREYDNFKSSTENLVNTLLAETAL